MTICRLVYYQSTRLDMPQDWNLSKHSCENLTIPFTSDYVLTEKALCSVENFR